METADAKNLALKSAGVYVPETFEDLPEVLTQLYNNLVQSGKLVPRPEVEVPKIPIDYAWAQELGLVRKPASFISTICDDRGQELLYAGMPISSVFKEDVGIGGVLSLLWFKRRLPDWAGKFIEMVLMLTADHGPAVSGAHNTIVTGKRRILKSAACEGMGGSLAWYRIRAKLRLIILPFLFRSIARAGKDLVSCLVAGLLTIGERFGGALDGAAQMFSQAFDAGQTPSEFVDAMRKQHKLILGIGHKIKSRTNPDLRVEIIKDFVRREFPNSDLMKYALEVETLTTSKKDNLILNVDGAVGAAFVDLLRCCGAFSRDEAEEYIKVRFISLQAGVFFLLQLPTSLTEIESTLIDCGYFPFVINAIKFSL